VANPRSVVAGRLGAVIRYRGHNDPDVPIARRELRVLEAEDRLRDLLAADPPPTVEQRRRLAALLLGVG
jgi:hypothetical protein